MLSFAFAVLISNRSGIAGRAKDALWIRQPLEKKAARWNMFI